MNDTHLVNILESVTANGGRIVLESSKVRFDGDDHFTHGWSVAGGGLGGCFGRTLRDSLQDWAEGLVKCAQHDPGHYARFADLLEATA